MWWRIPASPYLQEYSAPQRILFTVSTQYGKLKVRVPCHLDELRPCPPHQNLLQKKEAEYRRNMQADYNQRHRVMEGEEIHTGDQVWIPDLREEGTVESYHGLPRSLIIRTWNGTIRRNCRMVRKALKVPQRPKKACHGTPLHTFGGTHVSPMPSVPNQWKRLNLTVLPQADSTTTTELAEDSPVSNLSSEIDAPDEQATTAEPCPTRRSQRTVRKPRRYIEECWSSDMRNVFDTIEDIVPVQLYAC